MDVVYQVADNIISPLGFSTSENVSQVFAGKTGISFYGEGTYGVPEAFYASVIDSQKLENDFSIISKKQQVTRLEQMAILSVHQCMQGLDIDLKSKRTLFVFSTTKGNVGLMGNAGFDNKQLLLGYTARVVSGFFGNPNQPVVVSNACISGVSAQIVAKRFLQSGVYDHVVVVGAEELSKFIIAGFQSFKALAQDYCRPFDANRTGLNLGEGAATIVYSKKKNIAELPDGTIILSDGAITNDANHISGPSRSGEGLYLALRSVTGGGQLPVGFVNAHGTATPYNDEMESIALNRASLGNVPVNSLKGYFGHTLGAAGLIETVISSACLKDNMIANSRGYSECGVSQPVNVVTENTRTPLTSCIKMVSGFGGCNAAILLNKI